MIRPSYSGVESCLAELFWGLAEAGLEGPAKMALICKTEGVGDFGNALVGVVAIGKDAARRIQTLSQQPAAKCFAVAGESLMQQSHGNANFIRQIGRAHV